MSQSPAPRIGIIGTGAIGGFYGMLLARAGHDVHFLLRSEYAAVVERGLQLNSSVHGALHLPAVQAYRTIEDMPQCDWLLVGAKTTANAELAPLIAKAAPGAKVVLLQNGLAVEDELRPLLSEDLHLLGGLCYICVHRSAPGVIEHQALGAINLAYHSGPLDDEEARLALVEEGAGLMRSTGLDSAAMRDLAQTRWQKLVWNIPYNGLSVLLDADTRRMMGNADSRALIADMMQEVVRAAQALGYAMPENYADKLLAATQRMPDYLPSMYHDFAQGRAAELHAIYEAPLAAADAAGFDMPKVRALYQALRFIQARREA